MSNFRLESDSLQEKAYGELFSRQDYNALVRAIKQITEIQEGLQGAGLNSSSYKSSHEPHFFAMKTRATLPAHAIFNFENNATALPSEPRIAQIAKSTNKNNTNTYATNELAANTDEYNFNGRLVGQFVQTKVEIDDADPPEIGKICGILDDSFKAVLNGTGLLCTDVYSESNKNYASVVACGTVNFLVKAGTNTTADAVGDFNVWYGTPGSEIESDPKITYKALNKTGKDIAVTDDDFFVMLDINGSRYVFPIGGKSEAFHINCPSPGVNSGAAINILLPNGDTESVTNWTGARIDAGDMIRVMQDSFDSAWYMIKGEDKKDGKVWWGRVNQTLAIQFATIGDVELSTGAIVQATFWADGGSAAFQDRVMVWLDNSDGLYYFIKSGGQEGVRFFKGLLTNDMSYADFNATADTVTPLDNGTNLVEPVALINRFSHAGLQNSEIFFAEDRSTDPMTYVLIDINKSKYTPVTKLDWNDEDYPSNGKLNSISFGTEEVVAEIEPPSGTTWDILLEGSIITYVNSVGFNAVTKQFVYSNRIAVVFDDKVGNNITWLTPDFVTVAEFVSYDGTNLVYRPRNLYVFEDAGAGIDQIIAITEDINVLESVVATDASLSGNLRTITSFKATLPAGVVPIRNMDIIDIMTDAYDTTDPAIKMSKALNCRVWNTELPFVEETIVDGTRCEAV